MKQLIGVVLFSVAPSVATLATEYRAVNRYSLERVDTLETPATDLATASLAPVPRLTFYGPVQAGETLYTIALSLGIEHVTLNQIMMALFDLNPSAFPTNNINLLLQGALLRIPAQITTRSVIDARRLVAHHYRQWQQSSNLIRGPYESHQ